MQNKHSAAFLLPDNIISGSLPTDGSYFVRDRPMYNRVSEHNNSSFEELGTF